MAQIYLITGGAGFIGSNIAAALCARATHHVVISDTFGSGEKWRNLRNHPIHEIVAPGNLFYWLDLYGEKVDAVIHMGAISSTTETNADLVIDTNLSFSTLLYRWCAENGKRFIYASSAATYGDGAQGFSDDPATSAPRLLRPLNPYGWSKHLFDRYVATAIAEKEPAPSQWAGLKFFNVYGPNEYHKGDQRSVVCTKFPDAKAGKPARLFKSYRSDFTDGGQARDFIYVKDCVRVIEWLLANPKVSGLFNVGTGQARSFNDLAEALAKALGVPAAIEYFDMPETLRPQYQYYTQAPMEKLRAAGYTAPFASLEDGVRDYVQNYLLKDDPYL